MSKWMFLPCALLSTLVAAQTGTPVPAGTAIMVRLETTLATFSNRPGDPFRGSLSQPVVVNGQTLIPAGATVEGRVTKVSEPRRISGKPTIGILPEAVILPTGERYYLDATLTDTNIRGSDVNSEGQFKGSTHDRRDTLEQGGGTASGMIIGGLVGGPAGVLVGGVIGAGGTTGYWLAKHRSATLPAGTELTLELNRPLQMTASMSRPAPIAAHAATPRTAPVPAAAPQAPEPQEAPEEAPAVAAPAPKPVPSEQDIPAPERATPSPNGSNR